MAKKTNGNVKKFSINQLSSLLDNLGDETKIIIENDDSVGTFISTDVYILNAMFSKSILNGGIPNDRITILAGPPATGKSYIVYNVIRNAQKDGYYVIFIDTEHSINKFSLSNFGIKTGNEDLKLIVSNKVEDLKVFLTKFLDDLKKQKEAGLELPKILIALDSIGQLASNKEVEDSLAGNNKTDMSRAKAIKQMFRIINSDLGYLKIPMIATNHVYEDISAFFPQPVMAGGKGIEYSASTIVYLSTAKLKSGRENEMDLNATGVIVTAQAKKNRMAKPKKVKFQIDHEYGTNPFIGLDFYCIPKYFDKVGIAKGKRVDNPDGTIGIDPSGTKWYVKHLDKYFFEKQLFTPEVFNTDVLNALDAIISKDFEYAVYGTTQVTESDNEMVNDLEVDNDFDSIDSDSLFK